VHSARSWAVGVAFRRESPRPRLTRHRALAILVGRACAFAHTIMLTISVTRYDNAPPSHPIGADFGEAGGTIGRSTESTLPLPDPKRVISRTHATVSYRAGSYVLRDQGSATAVVVNGQPLGNGRECTLAPGDEIRIAGYVMRVELGAAGHLDDSDATRLAEDAGAAIERLDTVAGEDRPTVGLTIPGLVGDTLERPSTRRAAPPATSITWTSEGAAGADGQSGTVIVPSPEPDAGRRISDGATLPLPGTSAARVQPVVGNRATSDAPGAVTRSLAQEPARRAAAPPPATGPHAGGATPDALLRALLTGAGVGNLAIPGGLTPELMSELGQILRIATQGVLDLLVARALAKREVRADMTIIVAADNNPLKFSPDLEAALSHLLAPRGRGFMPPVRAVGDAYENLRSHQIGFMAGMHAALAVVLARFDPHKLEPRLTEKSMFDSILPMSHKAKLWDLYAELYGEISREAEDDFHSLFGREFLRAYQAQVAQLRDRSDTIASD
jgi:FHA domain-containing protein/type VI secretion system protein